MFNPEAIIGVRSALASTLGAALDLHGVAYPMMPGRSSTLYIQPTPGERYIDHRPESGASFSQPVVNLSAVIVAPPLGWDLVLDWIDARVGLAHRALEADPRLGGRVASAMIQSVAEPGLLQGTKLLATRLELAPLHVNELEGTA